MAFVVFFRLLRSFFVMQQLVVASNFSCSALCPSLTPFLARWPLLPLAMAYDRLVWSLFFNLYAICQIISEVMLILFFFFFFKDDTPFSLNTGQPYRY